MDPCDTETCENITDAICQLDNCGGCFAKFLLGNVDVTDRCGKKLISNLYQFLKLFILLGKCLPAEGRQVDLTFTSTGLSCLELSNGFVRTVIGNIVASGQLKDECMIKVLDYQCKMREKNNVQTTTFSLSILILCNKCVKFNGTNAPKDPKDIDIPIPNISTVTFMSESVGLEKNPKAKNPGLYCKCMMIKAKKGKGRKGKGKKGNQEFCGKTE